MPFGYPRRQRQRAGTPISDFIDSLGSGSHLDIERTLISYGDPPGRFEQDPQLGIGVCGTDMGQDRALTSMFAHYLHRDGS
ncbi:hypothetical protein MHEI_46560 [Mycobacterium heidelbergense]|nr:hypothetical protein MHEI_46560 [Mycobacterium heidelbergense]